MDYSLVDIDHLLVTARRGITSLITRWTVYCWQNYVNKVILTSEKKLYKVRKKLYKVNKKVKTVKKQQWESTIKDVFAVEE